MPKLPNPDKLDVKTLVLALAIIVASLLHGKEADASIVVYPAQYDELR